MNLFAAQQDPVGRVLGRYLFALQKDLVIRDDQRTLIRGARVAVVTGRRTAVTELDLDPKLIRLSEITQHEVRALRERVVTEPEDLSESIAIAREAELERALADLERLELPENG